MIFKLSWSPSNRLFHLSRRFVRYASNQENISSKLVLLHDPSAQQSYMELSQKFYDAMKTCASLKSISFARKIHAQLISTGLAISIFLQNHLLNMYCNCGSVEDAFQVFGNIEYCNVFTWNMMINGLADSGRISEAEKLFEEMPDRDSVSWNSMMSGYVHNGKPDGTMKVFALILRDCTCVPDLFSFYCAIKACGSLGCQKLAFQLHGLVEKFNFGKATAVETSVMDMYIKCGAMSSAERVFWRMPNPSLFCWNSMIYCYSKSHGAERALDFFTQMPERDTVSWNMMVSILSQHGFGAETLGMFIEMWNQGFRPNSMTYASALSACTSIYDLEWGTHLHARIVRMVPSLDVFMGSGLIDMYAKCARLVSARQVFDSLTEQNAVSWTSLISGVAQTGLEEEAFVLFNQMRQISVALDEFTLATVLGACSSSFVGAQLHAYAIKTGMDSYVPVGNALVTMYAKCGNTQNANHSFKLMPIKDVISWTAMITAFSQAGDVKNAREYFNKMPERNVITWNSMLGTYVQYGYWEEGLKLYILMRRKCVNPDSVTFTSSISACADLAILKFGKQLIAQAEIFGFGSNISVSNVVITMYSRCGQIEEARKVFDSVGTKNLISWNAMLAGYAQNGQGKKVIEIFDNMVMMECTPDHISYVSVLSGCSHSGLVTEGKHYFNSMTINHGISPTLEHFSCMVDLLGRAGLLEQAKNLINELPYKPNADIWGALLGACRIHHNTELAEFVMRNLLELDAENSGSYALLSNIYSDSGRSEGAADVRRLMREKGIQKNPGCSWIEVDNRVQVFTADDSNYPQVRDIHRMLEEIIKKIEDRGNYVKEISYSGSQGYHSEKLAELLWLLD